MPSAPTRAGLTETKEGRLAVIVVIAGTILVVSSFANVLGNNAADDRATDVRGAVREELSRLPDEQALSYPVEPKPIEDAVRRALHGQRGRLAGIGRPEHRRMTVVAIETGWTWWPRCVRAELRGDHTVLTRVAHGSC